MGHPSFSISTHVPIEAMRPVIQSGLLQIPVASDKVPAGFPSPAEPYATAFLDFNEYLSTNPVATISVYCGGESMLDAGISKDDLLIIDRSVTPKHRDIVMADLGNEYTIKRLHIGANGVIELRSENAAMDFPNFQFTDGDELVLVGVVMHIIKTPKR